MPLGRPGLFAALSGVTFLDLPPPDNPGSSEASWSGARRMRLTRDGPEVLIALRPGTGHEGKRGGLCPADRAAEGEVFCMLDRRHGARVTGRPAQR